jgi:hypothetical protein
MRAIISAAIAGLILVAGVAIIAHFAYQLWTAAPPS